MGGIKHSGKRVVWKIDISDYGGREFEGGFLGKIVNIDNKVIYAGPDCHHSLKAVSKQEATKLAQLICDAVNDHNKLKKLRLRIEALIYEIQEGMTIKTKSKRAHKSISEGKLEVFISAYQSLFGVDLNKYK